MKRLPLFILLLAVILSVVATGVYATWTYTSESPHDVSQTLDIVVGNFNWDGSEDLPDSVEGEDHAWLIRNLVAGVDDNGDVIGLNNPDSVLNDRINDRLDGGIGWREGRDYFGSMAISGGDEASQLFDAHTSGLSFIVQVESDTVYYIYTTSVYLGEKGEISFWGSNKTPGNPSVPIGEYIYPIYKTKLVRENTNSDFAIVETKRGKAKSDWYDENRSNANATQIPSFDINTWTEDEMGNLANVSRGIWTFVGDDPTAYATKDMQHVYYRITPKTAGTYTVWTSNLDASIKILASDGTTALATSSRITLSGGEERESLSWSASANTLYYIEITGDSVMQFHIQ